MPTGDSTLAVHLEARARRTGSSCRATGRRVGERRSRATCPSSRRSVPVSARTTDRPCRPGTRPPSPSPAPSTRSPSPLRCRAINDITSPLVTRAGVLSTTVKNTFKSNATARIVFGLALARKTRDRRPPTDDPPSQPAHPQHPQTEQPPASNASPNLQQQANSQHARSSQDHRHIMRSVRFNQAQRPLDNHAFTRVV